MDDDYYSLYGSVDEALCAIGVVEPDLDWYLDEWLRFQHPNAALNLLRFLQNNAAAMVAGKLRSDFWSSDGPAEQNRSKVIAWAKAEATLAAAAAAADRARSPEEREALEECYLRWLG